ncbi:MAG: DUF4358 domain-containing protein [Oscillospiraceae bacterium]|nr:DUF4358 domain-containing protein [Oscillospiraceae bacterium]
MKKIPLLISIIAIMAFSGGCQSDKNGANDSDITPNYADVQVEMVAQAILAEVEIPSAAEKGTDDIEYFIGSLDTHSIKELSYFICASGAYPDELLIIKFADADAAAAARSGVESRLESRRDDFRDYAPAEMYKFDDAQVLINGEMLFFYITSNNAKVREIIDSYM